MAPASQFLNRRCHVNGIPDNHGVGHQIQAARQVDQVIRLLFANLPLVVKEEILTLSNLIHARPLNQRLQAAHCACYFYATLNPPHYYQTLLGLPEDTVHLNVLSPFAHTQLQVHIAHNLSTRYKHRATAIAPICKIIQK